MHEKTREKASKTSKKDVFSFCKGIDKIFLCGIHVVLLMEGLWQQYLRISKQSKSDEKGRYLQTYENNHIQGKGTKSKFVKTPGYEKDIMASGIEDPVAHYRKLCKKQNEKDKKERKNKKLEKVTNECTEKNIGYFLVQASSITFASYICCIYALEFGQYRTSFWCENSSVPDTPYMQFLFVRPRFCPWVSMSPTSDFLQIPPRDGRSCLWLTVPTAKSVADFHRQVIAHAERR